MSNLLESLLLIVVGSTIGAVWSFLGYFFTNNQQMRRDQAAYERSMKDAKRERLRNSYRIILNAADTYLIEIQQLNHVPSYENISLPEIDEAVNEVILEDVGDDVNSIFFELRGAFNFYSANLHMRSDKQTWGKDVLSHKTRAFEKFGELKTAMKKHLKELESPDTPSITTSSLTQMRVKAREWAIRLSTRLQKRRPTPQLSSQRTLERGDIQKGGVWEKSLEKHHSETVKKSGEMAKPFED